MATSTILFHEEQSFPKSWFCLTLGGSLAVVGLAFAPMYAAGLAVPSEAVIGAAVIIGAMMLVVVGLLAFMKLRVEVDDNRLHVRFFPFVKRSWTLDEIRHWEARTYRPIAEYGGWGIRWSLTGKGRAYNTSGDQGVQLELSDGSLLLIGSQRAAELADAISQAKK